MITDYQYFLRFKTLRSLHYQVLTTPRANSILLESIVNICEGCLEIVQNTAIWYNRLLKSYKPLTTFYFFTMFHYLRTVINHLLILGCAFHFI